METGYDCEFVDGPPKELHWDCSICLLVLRQPYLVECCGHHFCKACLDRVSEANNVCPLCKQEKFKAIHNKGLERVLNERKVYCTHQKSGCEWTGELRQIDIHLNDQSSSAKDAPAVSAVSDKQPSSPNQADPLLEGCQFVEVCCRNCSATVIRNQMKRHLDICPNKPVKCKYCKTFTATPKDLEENHHPVCPKFLLPCPNKCGSEIQRKNIAKHVDTTCPLSKLECEYSHVGCTHVLTRKKMESHMKSASGMAAHLSLMEKAYAALKASEKYSGKLALQVKELEKNNAFMQEYYDQELQRISGRNAKLEKQVQSQSAEIRRLDAENRRLKAKLNNYYKFSSDDGIEETDYAASGVTSSTPHYHHSSYSSKQSYSTSGASYKSTAKALPTSNSSRAKPKPKHSDSNDDSGMGWGTALGVVGLGIAGGLGVAAALSSLSSSSDEKEKKSEKDSWY